MAPDHPTPESPNRGTLLAVARAIEPLLDEVVFVGGQVAELLITDPAAVRVRPTTDVDVIVRTTTRLEYRKVEKRLAALGLANDLSEGAPVCRWKTPQKHRLDVMPVDGSVLGFASRWYPLAVETATRVRLSDDVSISVPSAPAYIATKWDAYLDRGEGDLLASHDLEDVIAVVAGRAEIIDEVRDADDGLRAWLAPRVRGVPGRRPQRVCHPWRAAGRGSPSGTARPRPQPLRAPGSSEGLIRPPTLLAPPRRPPPH